MKFLKKPLVAVLLTVLLVVGSTFLSADRKLSRAALRVTNGFYAGIRYKGQVHESVAQSIRTLCADAEQLVIIGDNYGLDTAPLSTDAAALKQMVSSENQDISGVHAVFEPFYNKLLILVNDLEHSFDHVMMLGKGTVLVNTSIENIRLTGKSVEEVFKEVIGDAWEVD